MDYLIHNHITAAVSCIIFSRQVCRIVKSNVKSHRRPTVRHTLLTPTQHATIWPARVQGYCYSRPTGTGKVETICAEVKSLSCNMLNNIEPLY